jgi:dTDP-4-dehydrorhamnose reductase
MRNRQRMVVTGREGQIVRSLLERVAFNDRFEVIPVGRPLLDLSRPDTVEPALRAAKADIVVAAAAYTAVDRAEVEEQAATMVNGTSAGAVAATAAALGVPVIYLSTDYVFDGTKTSAYVERDEVDPINAYGRSKLAGERAVADETADHAILRTAWVYSPFGKNFLKTMLRQAVLAQSCAVVDDQQGNPTSALDIGDAILEVAANLLDSDHPELRGVFHMTGRGDASWADFALEISDHARRAGGSRLEITRVPSSAYPTPAKRPTNSRLDCTKLSSVHGVALPQWQVSTAAVVQRLM